MEVTLTLSTPEDRHVVTNMFVAFFYDLSQYDENLIINAHGLPTWAPAGLPGPRTHQECVEMNWWIRDDCLLYIIKADGNPAGFVTICTEKKHLPIDVDFELVDFYIAPKYRRQGIGWKAARLAFETRHGGIWQVFQLARNAPALAFWHGFIADYTGGNYESLDEGTQQRFLN